MKRLNYREVTKENFFELILLSKTLPDEQQQCVAPNVLSIGEGSLYKNAYYRGIYLEEKPIGFFMLYIPNGLYEEDSFTDFYLWRFMISYEFQKQHFGRETLDHIVNIGRELGFNKLVTSCHMGEVSPYQFYLKYGFNDTHTKDGDEEVLTLNL